MTEPARETLLIEGLCQHIASLTQSVEAFQEDFMQLKEQVHRLSSPVQDSSAPAVVIPPPEPRVPTPDRFSGDRSKFRAFRNSCELYFMLQPRTFTSETTKVRYVISLLQGGPQAWAHRLLEQGSLTLLTMAQFLEAMADLYDDPQRSATAEAAILNLRQGQRPAEEYVTDFRQWSADTSWNEAALCCRFRQGLSEGLKDELARREVPKNLKDLIRRSIQIDRRLRERQSERSSGPRRSTWVTPKIPTAPKPQPGEASASPPVTPKPMGIGLLRPSLTGEERQRRKDLQLCLYCGEAGHFVQECPNKTRKPCVSPPSSVPIFNIHLPNIPLSVQLPGRTLQVTAIIDSGASSCFIDQLFATQHGIPFQTKAQGFSLHLADGSSIRSGPVTQETIPLPTFIIPNHQEFLRLDIITSPLYPVILGIPWLRAHNPSINWVTGEVQFGSKYCQQHCLSNLSAALLEINAEEDSHAPIPQVYHAFLDVFSKQGAEVLPPHRTYDCPIDLLPGAQIPFGRIYPLSEPELKVLKKYVEDNLKKGFIRPSTSPAGAGIFFVGKKDGSLRPCIDYRDLNKITVKNRYPLPLIPELLQRLRGARIFTKLDLRGAYNLVRIRQGDEWKTAFRTRFGHFEYLVMPFGLCNAPATFQHFANDIFRDILDLFVVVYLDDILIFSSSLEQHREHVKRVLTRLRQHGLYAKAEKCEFERTRIQFLGLILSTEGIEMDPKKVSAILDWPVPSDKKGVQRFVGFANFYRRFIKGFSTLISPITQLTKAQRAFVWNPEAQSAFEQLKNRFTTAPILHHPDHLLPYVLEVDASENATGAILSQRVSTTALLHPVAYFSRKLNPAEKNYDVGDRELLAIKLALEEWRYLLEGAAHPIVIHTDHKNLEYLRSAKRLRPRQARWALFFTRFTFHITYRPGSKNGKADALSRMFTDSAESAPPDTILSAGNFLLLQPDLRSRLQQTSRGVVELPGATLDRRNGLLWYRKQIFVPQELRVEVLGLCHDHPMAGHFGVTKTTELVTRTFWWPTVKRDCEQYTRACTICARNKSSRTRSWGLLQPLPIPDRPWQMIAMDFIVELPPSEGHSVILVVVDRMTKMAHFIPLKNTPSAMETAKTFIREVIRLHGVPRNIVSDRGVQFTSRFWRALCRILHIDLSLSSAYHPQTNGQTERTNQTLEQYLRCFTSITQNDWLPLLPLAEFSFNNAVHSATHQSPFYANFGFHPSFLPDLVPEASVPATQNMTQFLEENSKILQVVLSKAQEDAKRSFDRRKRGDLLLKPGDKVWLSTANLRLNCPSKKLGPRYVGPFPVKRAINPTAYELSLPATFKIHPVFHVSLLKPSTPDPFPSRKSKPPDPVVVDDQEEYEVEAILDCRRRRGLVEYLIKWVGYGMEDNSWEPESNIHAQDRIKAFKDAHPEKVIRLGIQRLPIRRGQCQGNLAHT